MQTPTAEALNFVVNLFSYLFALLFRFLNYNDLTRLIIYVAIIGALISVLKLLFGGNRD